MGAQHNFTLSTSTFTEKVLKWNRETFGNIFHNKQKNLRRISGIQKSPTYPYSLFLQSLEQSLLEEYEIILQQEKDFWKLKSRVNWLNHGDRNTRFFHTIMLRRRRRNRIIALLNEDGSGNTIWKASYNKL